jgi:hypothetical protein
LRLDASQTRLAVAGMVSSWRPLLRTGSPAAKGCGCHLREKAGRSAQKPKVNIGEAPSTSARPSGQPEPAPTLILAPFGFRVGPPCSPCALLEMFCGRDWSLANGNCGESSSGRGCQPARGCERGRGERGAPRRSCQATGELSAMANVMVLSSVSLRFVGTSLVFETPKPAVLEIRHPSREVGVRNVVAIAWRCSCWREGPGRSIAPKVSA